MERLSPLDALFLQSDSPTVPRQVATLAILEPSDGQLDYDRLLRVIDERIDLVPRYRQVPRHVPGRIGAPVWADDENFDITVHVRRSALPSPGTRQALHELAGRLIARRLDLDRPLWELYLIEGLEGGEVALLFKGHQALIDGSDTVDIAQVLLEEAAHVREIPHEEWVPRPSPGLVSLTASTVNHAVSHPGEALRTVERVAGRVARHLPIVGASTPPSIGVLSAEPSRHRRFATVSVSFDDLRKVREAQGGRNGPSVNDIVLASIAGGLRGWMLTRAEPVTPKTSFRALVPMSITSGEGSDGAPTAMGSTVKGHLVSLPVGESNPVVRLHQVAYALKDHRETGKAVAAGELARLPGYTTSTFHAVGARVAMTEAGRDHHITITYVPGPADPVYLAGQQVGEVYSAIPLHGNRALSLAVTSYNGRVFYGLVGDRDAVPDLDVLAQCVVESVEELIEASKPSRGRAPRGRARPKKDE
ncbi:MAG: wax ester/triacylglycerol synthase family O-acyltransferase [Aeromicrobium sp.]|uniref:wax ester/triacylglycerol synthase family O-acyltransferase n=1 Tax=Aeromicrobium sp. TaxID=1871063 RepID=UPI0039E2503E